MKNSDTIYLLQECDAGTKMAVSTLDEVLEKISDSNLKQLLLQSKKEHETLGNEIHALLIQHDSEEKDPNPVARSMSWIKTNVKIGMDNHASVVADLVTDGCNMGIKTLYKYLNQYKNADEKAKELCNRLIMIEEHLRQDLRCYL